MEEEILKKYFQDKMKQIDIANELNISKYKVSRVVTKDSRYQEEKEYRKIINKKKHMEKTKKYIMRIRKVKRKKTNDDYTILKLLHNQDSRELSSGRGYISNKAFRNWNSSAYNYNSKTKSFVLRKDINAGADVPKQIKWDNK